MTFVLPFMFFTCFHYPMHDGEVMYQWHIQQPTVISVSDNTHVFILGGVYEGSCGPSAVFIELHNQRK